MISIQEMRSRQRLKKYDSYLCHTSHPITFQYEFPNIEEKQTYYQQLGLVGKGSMGDERYIFLLMDWVNRNIPHDGYSDFDGIANAVNVYKQMKDIKTGVNCKNVAIVMRDVLLLMGYYARYIICMPFNEDYEECHVVNIVYLPKMKKWIFIDPTMNAYIMNEEREILSIDEIRSSLSTGKKLLVSDTLKWNGQSYDADEYLSYLAKNMFRFACTATSNWATDMGESSIYVGLVPAGYSSTGPLNSLFTIDGKKFYKTTDSVFFWTPPI
ncbi:transglutaminase-like domain-containing protein [Paenibacillus sp. FSL W7-1287]|uniref:transglutaminase-like domain-containing protein n=1 Tax=Paenibacillus sp. FSL W7-1287 TaxID=2954538 RepID=UPI0030FB0755